MCFISISAVSASDDAITENITLANDEINLEVSDNIKTIDDLDTEIQDATPDSTVKLENDITASQDTKCNGIEISKKMTLDGQGHKIDGNSSDKPFFIRIHGNDVVLNQRHIANQLHLQNPL